jgi:hypothetical protein
MERYYNENPQVTLWKEKASKIKTLFDQYRHTAEMYNKRIVDALNDLTDEARNFNALPWYKKMFFKFKI